MKSLNLVVFALLMVPLFGSVIIKDLTRIRHEASSTDGATSEGMASVEIVPVRRLTEDPGLPASHLDGGHTSEGGFSTPTLRPYTSFVSGGDANPPRDQTEPLTSVLGEPRRVRTVPVGSELVQSGPSRSEGDVRAILREMRHRYGTAVGNPETIRHAGADGTMLYHVRLGPFARNDADRLCEALRETGDACPAAQE